MRMVKMKVYDGERYLNSDEICFDLDRIIEFKPEYCEVGDGVTTLTSIRLEGSAERISVWICPSKFAEIVYALPLPHNPHFPPSSFAQLMLMRAKLEHLWRDG